MAVSCWMSHPSSSATFRDLPSQRAVMLFTYVQDKWQATPKLTVISACVTISIRR